jgi:hypothetical protein
VIPGKIEVLGVFVHLFGRNESIILACYRLLQAYYLDIHYKISLLTATPCSHRKRTSLARQRGRRFFEQKKFRGEQKSH